MLNLSNLPLKEHFIKIFLSISLLKREDIKPYFIATKDWEYYKKRI